MTQPMHTGLNTEIQRGGCLYHVQTETHDRTGQVVETLVYAGGEILARMTTSLASLAPAAAAEPERLRYATRRQHWYFVRKIEHGMLDGEAAPAAAAPVVETPAVEEDARREILRAVEERIDAVLTARPAATRSSDPTAVPALADTAAARPARRRRGGRLAVVVRW